MALNEMLNTGYADTVKSLRSLFSAFQRWLVASIVGIAFILGDGAGGAPHL
jgi:hypothetical protein